MPSVPQSKRAAFPGEAPPDLSDSGYLSELFCSVQGEGPYVGERQVFLRTAGCSATCTWCDTIYGKVLAPRFVVHGPRQRTMRNPVPLLAALDELLACASAHAPVRTVSVTGGEPLEQPRFVAGLAAGARRAGLRVHLETSGMHAGALERVIGEVDVVAMDIKLPSAIGREAWEAHRAFLGVVSDAGLLAGSAGAPRVFVKVVVDDRATHEEIARAVEIVAETDARIPLVLQPETEAFFSPRTPHEEAERLAAFVAEAQRRASCALDSVRVIPQCHKILGVR
jgi:organic radical activating enzyme